MPRLQTAEVSPAVRVHLNPLDLTRAGSWKAKVWNERLCSLFRHVSSELQSAADTYHQLSN